MVHPIRWQTVVNLKQCIHNKPPHRITKKESPAVEHTRLSNYRVAQAWGIKESDGWVRTHTHLTRMRWWLHRER